MGVLAIAPSATAIPPIQCGLDDQSPGRTGAGVDAKTGNVWFGVVTTDLLPYTIPIAYGGTIDYHCILKTDGP